MRSTGIVAIAAVGVVLGSSTVSAQQKQTTVVTQAPPTEREVIRPNRPLLVAGALVIAASYIPPVVVAATSDHAGDDKLYIPVAGPWLDLGERGGCRNNSCGTEAVYKGLLIATGVAHAIGTGLLVSSLIVPEEHYRRDVTTEKPKPMVVPTSVGRNGAGLTLVGIF